MDVLSGHRSANVQITVWFAYLVQVCGFMKPGSVLLLVARSETLLQELKEELRGSTGTAQPGVRYVAVDLSAADGVNEVVEVARQEAGTDPDHVLLINNAGESLLESVKAAKQNSVVTPAAPTPPLFLSF